MILKVIVSDQIICLLLLVSVAYKRGCGIAFYSSTDEEITLPHEFFCVYPIFHWGDIVKKVLSKAGNSKKRLKSGFEEGGGGGGWEMTI